MPLKDYRNSYTVDRLVHSVKGGHPKNALLFDKIIINVRAFSGAEAARIADETVWEQEFKNGWIKKGKD